MSVKARESRQQTWKKLIYVHNPTFGVEKCPLIQIDPKHINVHKITIFIYEIFLNSVWQSDRMFTLRFKAIDIFTEKKIK